MTNEAHYGLVFVLFCLKSLLFMIIKMTNCLKDLKMAFVILVKSGKTYKTKEVKRSKKNRIS